MKIRGFILTLGVASVSAACSTSLAVVKVDSGNFKTAGAGSSYYLPQQAVRVAVTYQVQSCEDTANIIRSAEVTTLNRVDEKARFVVPVSNLTSRFKTTSLTVGVYDDGTLRSLGATVDDRSAEIINGVVGTASSFARLATGAALSGNGKCSETTKANLEARDTLLTDLRNPTKFVEEEERAAAVDSLSRLNASLQVVRNITFLPNRSMSTAMADRVSREFNSSSSTESALKRWMEDDGNRDAHVTSLLAITVCIVPGNDGGTAIKGMNAAGCNDDSVLSISDAVNAPTKGLVYRAPRRVGVQVCGESCSDGVLGSSETVALAQFGDWRNVELNSKAFQDKNAMASWTQAGQLTSLTIGSSSSIEALASTLNSSASTAREAIGEIVTTDLERLNAEVSTVRAEADLLEQRARLLGLQMTPQTEDQEDND